MHANASDRRQDRGHRRRYGVCPRPVPVGASRARGTPSAIVVKSAAELLARVRADLEQIDLDRPRSPAAARARRRSGPRRSAELDDGSPAAADFQRHHRQRRRSARAGRARRRRLRQRIQRGAAHPAVARAAPVPGQLQSPQQSARVVLGIPIQHRFGNTHRRGADAQSQPRRHRDPDHQSARSGVEDQGALPHARLKRDIDAEGRVAWSDRRVGMGIQFETVDPAEPDASSTTSSTPTSSPTGRRKHEDDLWRPGRCWLALVFANGFFVAAEFAIVTVRKTRVDQLIARRPPWRARRPARRHRARELHRRHPARHHHGQPRPRLDRRAGAGLR